MINYHQSNVNISTATHDIESKLDLAWSYINQRNALKAEQVCLAINEEYPNNADGWYARSFLAFQLKNTKLAMSAINEAIKLQPQNLQWQLQKVNTLLLMKDKVSASHQAQALKGKKDSSLVFCGDLAAMFTKLGNFEQANYYYQQALTKVNATQQPKECAQLHFNIASIARYQGHITLAEQHLNHALALNPDDYEAYLLRASLKKQSPENNHIKQLEHALRQSIKQPIGKAQLLYALAKEQEDLALYSQSFNSLNKGAKIRRQHMQYDIEHDLSTLRQIRKTFNREIFQQHQNISPTCENQSCDNNEAIFILGLPRTGSTLVERIVSNHTDVNSAGELNNFALCMMDEVKKLTTTAPTSRAELVQLTSKINFKNLGENYITSTRPETGNTPCFIDKLPLNSLYVGLIHLALPKAKIIHVTRHPLDTCYSIYKQLFTNGYPFSYQLTELAQYYIEHYKMMQHWHKQLPTVMHQVAYEDLVNDLPKEAKKLISYCQLDWQAQCSDFQNNKAPSTTASATQVREKIYSSSKGQWRNYQQELLPVKQQLEQAGICCD